MSSLEDIRPKYTGTNYVRDSVLSIVFDFIFNNVRFSIVAASPDDEAGGPLVSTDYDFEDSIEGKILDKYSISPCMTGTGRGRTQSEKKPDA